MEHPMFTVKHVANGDVFIYPAKAIQIIKCENDLVEEYPKGIAGPPMRMEFDPGDGSGVRHSIDWGVVYVMNSAGKTIESVTFAPKHPAEDKGPKVDG